MGYTQPPKPCKRNKYADRETAKRSSFVFSQKTGKRTGEPEYCGQCQAYHLSYAK